MVAKKTRRTPEPKALRVDLPLPPSSNNLYPGRSRRHPSAELKAFWVLAAQMLNKQKIPKGGWEAVEAMRIDLWVWVPTARSDWDNRIKAGQDFLASWLGFHDSRVQEGHVYRYIDPARPRAVIELRTVPKARKGGPE